MFLFAVLSYVAMVLSLTAHEYCHGLVATLLGDDTARRSGRLTLNPLAHLDLIGTVILPIVGILAGVPLIGWAKPVPYNPYNVKWPRLGPLAIALAGPGSNFLMALAFLTLLRLSIRSGGLTIENALVVFLEVLALVNLSLGVFNLFPIPPLDGSKILQAIFTSPRYQKIFLFLERRGFLIIWGIILLDSWLPWSPISSLFWLVIRGAFGLFGFTGLV